MPSLLSLVRCLAVAVGGVLLLSAAPSDAAAGEWMFRRSYYSHGAPPVEQFPDYPRPYSRSAYRPAVMGTTPGFAVRGGFRYSHIILGSGRSVDVTVLHEDWMERQP